MSKLYLTALLRKFFPTLLILVVFCGRLEAQYPVQTPITANIDPAIQGYYEWLPPDYNSQPNKTYPILIFLHGIGEIGNGSQAQLPKVLVNGPPKLINNKTFPTSFTVGGKNFSFIVVTPQFNSNARNYNVVDNLVNYMVKKYRVDPTRIYLTGLSMGGGISWIYAAGKPEFADRLAALLVVCGNTQPYPANVKILAESNLPVKVMHNSGDPTVPVAYSIDWVNDLNASLPPINPPAKLTVFNASGHDAWSKAYDPNYKENGQNVYEWMLNYSRGGATAPPPPPPPANKPPVANAGTAQTITLPVSSVTLNGSASSDPDGTISSYSWKYVSGPTIPASNTTTAQSIVVSGLIKGTYVFQLTVTDNKGATATSQVKVVVNPAVTVSLPPIAVAGAGVTITLPLSSYQLDGSKSSAPAGSIASYQWSYVSGPSSYNFVSPTSALTIVNKLVAGTYVFQLTVTDNKGGKSSSQVTVVVKPVVVTVPPVLSNKPPVANAGPNTTITLPLSSFWLDGTKSTDPDGTIVSYAWSKVSGPNSYNITAPTTSRNIVNKLIAGTYVFQLTVKDNSGATNSTQVTLTVNPAKTTTPPPPPPPVNNSPIADAGANTTITLPLSSFWLDGTKSKDPDGTIVSYVWSKVSGPSSYNITAPTTVRNIVNRLVAGTYVFQLTVTDNGGLKGIKQVTLTVKPAKTSAATNQFDLSGNGLELADSAEAETQMPSYQLYPNPVQDVLNLKWLTGASGKSEISIIDISGNIKLKTEVEEASSGYLKSLNISSLSRGVYFIRIYSGGKLKTLKFIKQ